MSSPMTQLERKYHNDPVFYAMVQNLVHSLEQVYMTPSELREAAVLACMVFEERHPQTLMGYGRMRDTRSSVLEMEKLQQQQMDAEKLRRQMLPTERDCD